MLSHLEWSSLSALLPFFSAVPKGGGNLDTDQFWGMLVKEQNLILNTSSGTQVVGARAIKNARILQKKAAGMLRVLQTLARSLEEMNATFGERTDRMVRRHGLGSLPDEILSHILGLSALRPFFSAVPKGDESLDTDQFWGMLVKEQNLILDTSSGTQVAGARAIKNARMLQEKAAGMLLTLQTLALLLEEMNATFEERTDCMALRQGLDSLPNETLEHILGSVTSVFTEALGLSQVCSRFRQVMLDSPHIWANCVLNTDMNPRQIGALIDRKRNCPVKIVIGGQNQCDNWSRRVETLFSLNDRIEELEFHWLSTGEYKHISRQYSEFQVANLRNLTIKTFNPGISDFYASWFLPNLKCLCLTNFIPAPVFGQNLSYCHMEFSHDFKPETLKFFLQSLTSLETLDIELVDIYVCIEHIDEEEERDEEGSGEKEESDDDDDKDLSSRISNITSFSFTVIGKTVLLFARRVLETVPLNVTEMSLTVVYYNRDNGSKTRNYFNKLLRRFPMLKNLHLHFSGLYSDYHLDFSDILLEVPRSLENLRIEAPGHTLFMSGCDHTPPRLRTLQFRNCDRMDFEFLKAVRDDFLLNDVVIGKAEVVGCRLVEKEKLQDAFPNSEVLWKT